MKKNSGRVYCIMKRKKTWYIPGIISLVGLPVLFLICPVEDKPVCTVITHFLPHDEPPGSLFSKQWFYESVKDKKIVTINLWENSFPHYINSLPNDVRETKRRFIHEEMLRLQLTHDTSRLLKIELGSESTYGDFVWLVNEALMLNVKRYMFADSCFFFIPNTVPDKATSAKSDFSKLVPAIWHPPTEWDVFKARFRIRLNEVTVIAKKNNLLVGGFIILILIPVAVRTIVNSRKRKQGAVNTNVG